VHALGVRQDGDGSLDIAAPFGFDDLFNMVIRPNRAIDNSASHEAKAAVWPAITVIPREHYSGPQNIRVLAVKGAQHVPMTAPMPSMRGTGSSL